MVGAPIWKLWLENELVCPAALMMDWTVEDKRSQLNSLQLANWNTGPGAGPWSARWLLMPQLGRWKSFPGPHKYHNPYRRGEHRLLGHVMVSGSFLTKRVTGYGVCRILKEHICPIPEYSKPTMASQNSSSTVPYKLWVALCLNALKVKTGPKNRMQVVSTANLVGCNLLLSIVGVIKFLRS